MGQIPRSTERISSFYNSVHLTTTTVVTLCRIIDIFCFKGFLALKCCIFARFCNTMTIINLKELSDMLLRFETTEPRRPHFALFDTPPPPLPQVTGEVDEIFEQIFRTIICAVVTMTCFSLPIFRFVSKPMRFKGDYSQKSRPNFALFDPPPVKIRRVMGKMSE